MHQDCANPAFIRAPKIGCARNQAILHFCGNQIDAVAVGELERFCERDIDSETSAQLVVEILTHVARYESCQVRRRSQQIHLNAYGERGVTVRWHREIALRLATCKLLVPELNPVCNRPDRKWKRIWIADVETEQEFLLMKVGARQLDTHEPYLGRSDDRPRAGTGR